MSRLHLVVAITALAVSGCGGSGNLPGAKTNPNEKVIPSTNPSPADGAPAGQAPKSGKGGAVAAPNNLDGG